MKDWAVIVYVGHGKADADIINHGTSTKFLVPQVVYPAGTSPYSHHMNIHIEILNITTLQKLYIGPGTWYQYHTYDTCTHHREIIKKQARSRRVEKSEPSILSFAHRHPLHYCYLLH